MGVHVGCSREVAEAIAARKPVVALESTLLAHGMPAHRRVDVARALSNAVSAEGAVAAIIAVVDGQLRAGLDEHELHRLCHSPGVTKAAERDLAVAMARGGLHATTVSSTMVVARHAGIRVFATGGIGGVHRGVVDDYDESQDLVALARHPVVVVSAGAKAILDLPRTLERLETLGVLVLGWRCNEFPAFYTRSSGLPLEHRLDDVQELARVVDARFRQLEQGGVLLCNPVPEDRALPRERVDAAIDEALVRARTQGIHGKALTPFLLGTLEQLTGGESVDTNLALAVSNARVAAQLAVALAALRP